MQQGSAEVQLFHVVESAPKVLCKEQCLICKHADSVEGFSKELGASVGREEALCIEVRITRPIEEEALDHRRDQRKSAPICSSQAELTTHMIPRQPKRELLGSKSFPVSF